MPLSHKHLILASQSLQRKILCQTLKIKFKIIPSNINEKAIRYQNPSTQAKAVAKAKAIQVLKNNPKSIVFAADTFVASQNKIFEKPADKQEAVNMLRKMSGKSLIVYTGFAYYDTANNLEFVKTAQTKIKLRRLSNFEIKSYVDNYPVTTWSAAFSPAYPEGMSLVSSINGSFTGFTHGLPLEFLVPLLIKSGVPL
jgi:septum formation protein